MTKILNGIFWLLALTGVTGWGTLALYYGDSHTGPWQIAAAAAFVVSGIVAAIDVFWQFGRWPWRFGHLLIFFAVLGWWLSIAPSNHRNWQTDVARLPHATIDGDRVTLHDIRNFDYRSEFDYQPAYYDKSFDLGKLQGVDLFAFYWMGPAIAHTIMSFDFGEQGHLAVSIETRKQQGEEYSTSKGFFRQYELIYIVADERDVIRLRTNYRNNPPEEGYLYPLTGEKENARRLFLNYLKTINELYERPRFYNTLIDNCTVAIWLESLANTNHLPFSWKILLSGYLPEYLYASGRMERHLPFAELQQQANINQLAKMADRSVDFSRLIRTEKHR